MPTLEERIALTHEERDAADMRFRDTLREAREAGWSWSQLANASGMSMHGVRYLTLNLNARRQARDPALKGGKNDSKKRKR